MRRLESAYISAHQRVSDLVASAPEQANDLVPACPDWRVRDVVAHVTGVCHDILTGNLAGAASDPWTEAQVAARRDVSLDELLAEWAEAAPPVAAMLDDFPEPYGRQVIGDVTVHEHDIRGALHQPGARDSEALGIGLDFLSAELAVPGAAALGLDPLDRVLSVDDFELFRALSGRRSAAQIKAYDWRVDPEPYLPVFGLGPFTMRATELVE